MSEARQDTISVGAEVFAEDGERLGRVKELAGEFFKVDAPSAPDFWLRTDCVASIAPERVVLAVDKDSVGDIKVDSPDDEDVEPPPSTVREGLLTGSMPPFEPVGFNTWELIAPDYRAIWLEQFGATPGGWEAAEPAYRYGHQMASNPRYAGRAWEEVEPELGVTYGGWLLGNGYDEGFWEDAREYARVSWDDARRTADANPQPVEEPDPGA
jgi:hypothetical protein